MIALLFLFAMVYSEMRGISYALGRERKEVTFSLVFILVLIFIQGWPTAVLVAAAAVAIADARAGKPLYKAAFNASVAAVATLCAGLAYQLLLGLFEVGGQPVFWMRLAAGFAAGLLFAAVETVLVTTMIARAQGGRPGRMIRAGLGDSLRLTVTLSSIAIIMGGLWQHHPTAALLAIPSILMTRSAFESSARLRTEAQAMLAAVADLLDLRDFNTGRHSDRVADMAWGVAGRLGIPEDQALGIRIVARVHDIGKIAVSDAALRKPGRLSVEEIDEIRTHVQAGAQILGYLSLYRPLTPILAQHHERLDGRGYPLGLRSEDIEIGGRILAACDAYDAMTSDRPYRRAIAPAQAMAELYRCAGSQFDPSVVQALEAWLIDERKLRPSWRVSAKDIAFEGLAPNVAKGAAPAAENVVELPRAGILQLKY